jgi:hypothetical protein
MRRVILWIVALLITFAIGTGLHSLRRFLFTTESTVAAKVEVASPVFITTASEPIRQPNLMLHYNQGSVDHYGALYIMDPAPEGFTDFAFIALGLSGMHVVESSDYITLYSNEFAEWGHADFAFVTERYLYFTTGRIENHDFEYRFEGEFLVKDFDSVEGKNQAAVRGTLTKFKNGETVARQEVTFRVEYMGC